MIFGTSCLDTGLTPGTEYIYKVVAMDSTRTGPESNTVIVFTKQPIVIDIQNTAMITCVEDTVYNRTYSHWMPRSSPYAIIRIYLKSLICTR